LYHEIVKYKAPHYSSANIVQIIGP